jgi:hypothetical protein
MPAVFVKRTIAHEDMRFGDGGRLLLLERRPP